MTERDDGERIIDFDGRDAERDDKLQKEADLRKEQRRAFLLRLLNDPLGRDWIWGLLREFGTFEMIFGASINGVPDPHAHAYYRGRHSAGWRIWTELDDLAPDLTSLMRREHQ